MRDGSSSKMASSVYVQSTGAAEYCSNTDEVNGVKCSYCDILIKEKLDFHREILSLNEIIKELKKELQETRTTNNHGFDIQSPASSKLSLLFPNQPEENNLQKPIISPLIKEVNSTLSLQQDNLKTDDRPGIIKDPLHQHQLKETRASQDSTTEFCYMIPMANHFTVLSNDKDHSNNDHIQTLGKGDTSLEFITMTRIYSMGLKREMNRQNQHPTRNCIIFNLRRCFLSPR